MTQKARLQEECAGERFIFAHATLAMHSCQLFQSACLLAGDAPSLFLLQASIITFTITTLAWLSSGFPETVSGSLSGSLCISRFSSFCSCFSRAA